MPRKKRQRLTRRKKTVASIGYKAGELYWGKKDRSYAKTAKRVGCPRNVNSIPVMKMENYFPRVEKTMLMAASYNIDLDSSATHHFKDLYTAALQDARGYPYDDGQVYSTTRGWVRQSECLSSKQNNRVHFGMCTKHTNGLCRMPSYPRPHKRGDSKFNKMTHMTENIYCLTKIVGKLVGFDLNLCVYNHYDAKKKQRINMHSDTQTDKPKEIAHKQFTPVVSLTVHGEMNFNVHVNRGDKAGRVLSKLNNKNLFVWGYDDDQGVYHSVDFQNGSEESRECFVFRQLQKFANFDGNGKSV